MLVAFVSVSLTLVGIFVAQYALAMFLRLRRVFIPLTRELTPKIHNAEKLVKLVNKQRTERAMSFIMLFLMPFLVLVFSQRYWCLSPYFVGFLVGALMLRGKTTPSENNSYLYFYNYRFYVENELEIRDDPAYSEYMQYRRRSLIEQALDAEERKYKEQANKAQK